MSNKLLMHFGEHFEFERQRDDVRQQQRPTITEQFRMNSLGCVKAQTVAVKRSINSLKRGHVAPILITVQPRHVASSQRYASSPSQVCGDALRGNEFSHEISSTCFRLAAAVQALPLLLPCHVLPD